MNIFSEAKKGVIPSELKFIAEKEKLPVDFLLPLFEAGKIVILKNRLRSIDPVALGEGLTTKINANIGASPDFFDIDTELRKLEVAVKNGADAVMDLSIGGDVKFFRKKIIEQSLVPLGTVPLYEVAMEMNIQKKSIIEMTIKDFLEVVQEQAQAGVDFMTIHSGVTLESIKSLKSQQRIIGITSRGGAIIAEWMNLNHKENPLYEYYDEILDILAEYNVTISLGDGLRPGAINDANDRGQIHEMIILGELTQRAREKNVQVIIEGPGHMPLNMIADNVRLQKKICEGAPYYVLGPLVTDIAPGYDHLTGAIGGTVAAASGADFLCYVTPAEHLRLPTEEDVKEGVIASKIAAHAADLVKLGHKAKKWDDDISWARKNRDWEKIFSLALDEEKARRFRGELPSKDDDQCSMCGEHCAIKKEY